MPYYRPRTAIGRRTDSLTVRVPQTSDDGMGGQVVGTPSTFTVWANPLGLDERSREVLTGGQVTARQAYHFDVAYRTDLRPSWQIVWRGKVLEIQNVADDDGRKKRVIVYATEVP